MQSEKIDKKIPNPILIFNFYCALGAYPVFSFLWRRSYPFLTAEVFLLLAMIIILGLVLTTVFFRVRLGVTTLLTTLMVLVACLIQFNLQLESILILVVMVISLTWVLKYRFYQIGLPILLSMMVGAWADSLQHPDDFDHSINVNSNESGIPPVIHVLLDGFTGLDGLPPYPASSIFKKEIIRLFQEYGFKTFPRAYSRYPFTGESLNTAMNFVDYGGNQFTLEVAGRERHVLASNAYFDLLEDLGYKINIYQTAHLNFCHSNPESIDKCWNYTHPNVLSIREVSGMTRRASMLMKVMTAQSFVLSRMGRGLVLDPAIAVHDPEVFETLQRDVITNPSGRVFFAHSLIPHYPFVYLHDCSVEYESDPSLSRPLVNNDDINVRPEFIEYLTMRYFEQAECALLKLREMFDEMKSKDIFDQSYIIVHGDHGSHVSGSLPRIQNIEALTGDDYRAYYSILFAMKEPYGAFEVDNRKLPLNMLIEEFSNTILNDLDGKIPLEIQLSHQEPASFIYILGNGGWKMLNIDIFDD